MDLFAYAQIDILEEIAKENNIEVPRLRGYRLMAREEPITEEYKQHLLRDAEIEVYERFVHSVPFGYPDSGIWGYGGPRSEEKEKKYLIKEKVARTDGNGDTFEDIETVGFRWDLLNRKARNRLKLAIKRAHRAVLNNCEMYSKYAGRNDVLYIHARIGGPNWGYYGGHDIEKEPWFLGKVDDIWDDTYCDIYAKINPVPEEFLKKLEEEE